ncbi:acriflavin resistance protein [Methylocella silvestris BL2]|uniref:Acriflavin resistance protein n=1 Tax=Methylocella silvestris (strain DSM 15510 / CIP 108128 / LMG 27833 / NCIMB 13906 / BL2) TaxID=395965 RepID=B8ETC4_METSB|nr:efflux RND transporter permease subunit [Methylocella silvestris]ACK51766.1 acriflavin resistance protein [Methylocella silvestris BL2]
MLGIVRTALLRPYTFVVMALLIVIYGGLAILRTPTDIFPNIGIPVISAVWVYTGLPPDDMAGRIVSIYERMASVTVNDIEHIESQSLSTYGIVKFYFQPKVDISAAQAQVAAMSQTVLKSLPPGVTPPQLVVYNAASVPILQLALSSDSLSQTKLYDLASNFIRPQLATIPGAQMPSPYGGATRQIQIDLDQRALHAHGLDAQDVANALAAQNLITPVGTQKIGPFEYVVNLNDSPRRLEDLNNVPIRTVNGAVVFMRDVAFVHDGSPPQINVVQTNGKKAILISIVKNGSASTLDIIAAVKRILPAIQQGLPAGVDVELVNDQSTFVKSSVSNVVREGVIAAALTGFMILVFLGSWRSTLIITISIPLAILTSLIVLSLLGESINVMTLGGLALAIGILVDDATVTIENVNRHLEHGEDIKSAVLNGAHEIMPPATIALLCICVAFVPLLSLGGVAGYLFRPLAEAVVFAMAASYALTYTLVPTMAQFLLRNHRPQPHGAGAPESANPFVRLQRAFERRFEQLRKFYVASLQLALANRLRFAGGTLSFAVLSLALFPALGQDFFPAVEGGAIKIHIRAPNGVRVEGTTVLCQQIDAAVRDIIPPDRIESIVDNIGLPNSGINLTYGNSGTIGVSDADILITLKEGRVSSADYEKILREKLPRAFPGVTFAFLPADIVSQILNFGSPSPLDVQIAGQNINANREFARLLLTRMRRVPGIADARVHEVFQAPALKVEFNRELAGLVGLTERDASTNLQSTLSGSAQVAPTYWLNPANGVSYPVSIQTPQYDIDTLAGLKNLPLSNEQSTQLLGAVANITTEPASAIVSHYNIQPAINIYAATQGRDLGGVAADIEKIIADMRGELPKGSSVVIRGQAATMTSAYEQLFFGLGFSIVLIYLLIVVNFQSWLDPFVIISALPAALAGIVWMLFLTYTPVSVPALTGAIMCMGVATANSILVVSFAREQFAAGKDAVTAAMAAGATRFRPVIMTALAMIIGMLPMAIEPGQNAPLGRAVIGGLLFATCATLLFVPAVFAIVHGHKARSASTEPLSGEPFHA